MNRLDYDKERGIPLEENLYEQSQTELKQLLMKLFAVSLSFSCFNGDYKSRKILKQWKELEHYFTVLFVDATKGSFPSFCSCRRGQKMFILWYSLGRIGAKHTILKADYCTYILCLFL